MRFKSFFLFPFTYIVLEFPFFSSHGEKSEHAVIRLHPFADTRTPSPTLTLGKIPSFQTTFEQTCLFPSLESIQKSTLPLDRILDRVKSRFESVTRSSKLESEVWRGGRALSILVSPLLAPRRVITPGLLFQKAFVLPTQSELPSRGKLNFPLFSFNSPCTCGVFRSGSIFSPFNAVIKSLILPPDPRERF